MEPAGSIEWRDGRIQSDNPRLALDVTGARLDFSREAGIRLSQFDGKLNGGKISGSGVVKLDGLAVGQMDMNFKGQDMFLEYPEGLQMLVSTDMSVRTREKAIVVGGAVNIKEGGYRDEIRLQSNLVKSLTNRQRQYRRTNVAHFYPG
jgi:autotransporter translocation and assembly factor TamB